MLKKSFFLLSLFGIGLFAYSCKQGDNLPPESYVGKNSVPVAYTQPPYSNCLSCSLDTIQETLTDEEGIVTLLRYNNKNAGGKLDSVWSIKARFTNGTYQLQDLIPCPALRIADYKGGDKIFFSGLISSCQGIDRMTYSNVKYASANKTYITNLQKIQK